MPRLERLECRERRDRLPAFLRQSAPTSGAAPSCLRAALPGLWLTLSCEVCPEIREYERFTTASANAYIQPAIAGYLRDLEQGLPRPGVGCPLFLMTSGGGLMTVEHAIREPIRLVESGPAGGAILAARIAAECGLIRVLSFDMGGTTAKICLIDDGRPETARSFEIDRQARFVKGSGLPLRIPVIEMVEIGAGGGSIARLDRTRRIQVGPDSAGSDPGPACYGRGGTVRDRDGCRPPARPDRPRELRGRPPPPRAGARAACAARAGRGAARPRRSLAALGVVEMVDEAMANAARVHTVERGKTVRAHSCGVRRRRADPRGATRREARHHADRGAGRRRGRLGGGLLLHVSLVPYIGPSGELKTKPTQHSVAALRSIGIQPDAIVCRSDREIPEGIKRKISLMCDVEEEAVVTAADAPSIYDIPKVLHREGLDAYLVRRLDLPFRDVDWTTWDDLLRKVHHPKEEVTIALVGKYVDLHDAYLSVAEALRAGGFAHDTKVDIRWVPSDECADPAGAHRQLHDVDGILVPGGFGVRGLDGKLGALTYSRTHGIPTLGLCLGLQCMVIEYARNLAGLEKAASTEFDPECPEPVIATMEQQKAYVDGAGDLGGTMRLGLYPAELQAGSIVREAYGQGRVEERHRHRYEVNNHYREQLEAAGLVFSGTNPDLDLVEFLELPRDVHPYYVSTQAHPELRSRPTRPHPLFAGLIGAALERQKAERFPIDETGLRREPVDD